jgi:hypothetical protein
VLAILLAVAVFGFVDAQRELTEARRQRELLDAERSKAETVAGTLWDVQHSLTNLSARTEDSQQIANLIREAKESLQIQSARLAGVAPASATRPGATGPRIYIQIAEGTQRDEAASLRERIATVKVGGATPVVPGIELVKTPVSRSVLRCFSSEECATEGKELAGAINALLARPTLGLEDLSERYGQSKDIRPRHYEIWFAPGEIVLAPG